MMSQGTGSVADCNHADSVQELLVAMSHSMLQVLTILMVVGR